MSIGSSGRRAAAIFWRECENEWGKGKGYRERVAERSKQWFDDERKDKLNDEIESLLSTEWTESIERVSALLQK